MTTTQKEILISIIGGLLGFFIFVIPIFKIIEYSNKPMEPEMIIVYVKEIR